MVAGFTFAFNWIKMQLFRVAFTEYQVMAVLKSFLNISANDYDGERTNTQYGLVDLDATNVLAQTVLMDNIRAAHEDIILGVVVEDVVTYARTKRAAPGIKASNPVAQREIKWLVRYYDVDTFGQYTLEVGTANPNLLPPNGDRVNLQDGATIGPEFTAYKTAVEAGMQSPDGNDVKLLEAVLVGRAT